MYMDREADEERFLFSWGNIDNSDDYILLDELGYDYEVDDYETGAYAEIIKYLGRVSPHIRWRTTFDGTDSHGARPSRWRVICVPSHQYVEANYIFKRLLNGDDLENYCYTDRYPEIYDKLPGRKSKLKDHIIKLHILLSEYERLLSSMSSSGGQISLTPEIDLARFFEGMSEALPQVYYYANFLPYVSEASDLTAQGTMASCRDISLAPYDELFCIADPYNKNADKYVLSDLLISIYEDIEQGLIAFSGNQPDLIASAVNSWRIGFSGEHGWGHDILICLLAVHQAKGKISDCGFRQINRGCV